MIRCLTNGLSVDGTTYTILSCRTVRLSYISWGQSPPIICKPTHHSHFKTACFFVNVEAWAKRLFLLAWGYSSWEYLVTQINAQIHHSNFSIFLPAVVNSILSSRVNAGFPLRKNLSFSKFSYYFYLVCFISKTDILFKIHTIHFGGNLTLSASCFSHILPSANNLQFLTMSWGDTHP